MRRILFNLAAAVSLLLCLAASAAWFYSYSDRDFTRTLCERDSETSRMIFVFRGRHGAAERDLPHKGEGVGRAGIRSARERDRPARSQAATGKADPEGREVPRKAFEAA